MSGGQIAAAAVAVLIVAIVLWRRRGLSRERQVVAGLAVLALAVYASGLLSELPDPKKVIGDIAQALGPWTYALVGVLAFLETGAFVGLVVPGETVVIAGGVIAGQGEIDLVPLVGIVWSCAVLGDTTSFYIGRRLGRGFLEKQGPRVKITEERLHQVEGYFDRHGGKTILIGRFIGLVRALAPFIAGSSGLAYRRFIPYSIVGTGLWATTFCVLGYVFWQSFDRVADIAGQAAFGFAVLVAVVVGAIWAFRKLRDPARRRRITEWAERRRLLRPLLAAARFVAPQARFLWERVTPGDLGLQLTTSVAVAGVGLYVFTLYALIFKDDFAPTPLDSELLDLGDELRSELLVDIAKVVSGLGAFPTVGALVLALVVVLGSRRRVAELVGLVAGLVLVYVAVQAAKAGVDRPRPPAPLIDTSNSSYPSGHAAYATVWVAGAVAASWRLGLASRATLVFVALGLAAAIGLSRIYLRAHYFSDVAGGWGLGFGIFGLLAAVALVVVHLRHNEEERWTSTSRPSS